MVGVGEPLGDGTKGFHDEFNTGSCIRQEYEIEIGLVSFEEL
jgi:hypothetical protein